ncbi:MAG: PspC domain-containing protein, partial [Myxococcota bacterium]
GHANWRWGFFVYAECSAAACGRMLVTMARLYRSNDSRLFLGVCGGLAERYGWDPTWVRLAFVLGVFLGGPGILLYAIMALVVPRNPALSAQSYAAISGR